MSKKVKQILIAISIFVVFELSLLFASIDLKIWVKFGDPTFKAGLLMEILGEVVAPFIFIASGIIIAMYYNADRNATQWKAKAILGLVCAAGGLSYSIYLYTLLANVWLMLGCSIVTVALLALLIIMLKKVEPGRLFQLFCIAMTAVIYCISVLVIISLIKLFWGRVRPRDLQNLSEYTLWYLPQGITGNRSFPSGHTANASTLIVITMFAPLVKSRLIKVTLFVVPAIWIVTMAMSRILIGAHYCSDTLFAATISVILFILTKKLVLKFISKSLVEA